MSKNTIKLGQMEIQFLLESQDTSGSMTVFEFIVPPGAKVPLPHYHEAFDEAAYVLEGILTFTVDGKLIEVSSGESCFIPRGIVHGFNNLHQTRARTLSVLTPALLEPKYFIELAEIVNAGGPPNLEKVKEVMKKHGLVPVLPE